MFEGFCPWPSGAGVESRKQAFRHHSTGPSNSPLMHFCKNYGCWWCEWFWDFSRSAMPTKISGYFSLEDGQRFITRAQMLKARPANLQAAFDAGMGNGKSGDLWLLHLKLWQVSSTGLDTCLVTKQAIRSIEWLLSFALDNFEALHLSFLSSPYQQVLRWL